MNIRIIITIATVFFLSGCTSYFWPDAEGWKYAQKKEFLNILKHDKYMSLCDQGSLYKKVKATHDSTLMTKLLVAYANNLENSCIDMEQFKASQDAKRDKKVETFFETYHHDISRAMIRIKLMSGASIKNILKSYVPTTPQYKALVAKYTVLKFSGAKISKVKLKKIRLNIERTKLMRSEVGTHYALINIPEFQVRIIENNHTMIEFPVIVGQKNLQTPIFSGQMKYVEINPQWNVPDSIMRKTYIPKIKNNPAWVASQGMEIHKESYDLHTKKINPASVDWSKYPVDGKGVIPYKLIQVPSRKNGLGRVKFIFPNAHAVYMHDTQTKALFKKKVRTYSHGCIRLSKPVELLNHITTNYSEKNISTVKKWYDSLKTKHLILKKDLIVHTVYFTAYVNEKGKLKFFSDVYGFDHTQKLTFK